MPIYKNVARQISMQVRVTGGVTPYTTTPWPNSAVAKMYYSKDGAAAVAVTPDRVEATIGSYYLSTSTLTSTVWNCDELRIWWEGSGIDFGELTFYPEDSWTSTKAGYVDAAISGRMATYTQPTGFLAATFPATVASTTNITAGTITTVTNLTNAPTNGDFTATMKTSVGTAVAASAVASVTGNVGGNVTGSVGSVSGNVGGNVAGSVGSVASGGITAASFATNAIDNAALAANAVTEIAAGVWDALASGVLVLNSMGALIKTNLDAVLSSVQTAILAKLPSALVGGKIDANVGSMDTGVITSTAIAANAIGASELASDAVAEIADAVWDEVQAGHTTAGTFGKYLDAEVSTVGGGSAPTAAAIADAVWDEAISGHLTAGSTGNALNAAGSAGDPWSTPIPGAYGAGTAGKILGDNINATISSRASQTSVDTVDDLLDTEVAAIKADTAAIKLKTDALPSDPADASDIAASFSTVNTKLDTIDDLLDTEIGTIITAVAAVQADTDNIQTRLPNALVGGKMDSNIGSMDNGVVTAAAIATDAIDNDAIAANAVTEIQSGLATAAELALTKAAAQAAATAAGQIG